MSTFKLPSHTTLVGLLAMTALVSACDNSATGPVVKHRYATTIAKTCQFDMSKDEFDITRLDNDTLQVLDQRVKVDASFCGVIKTALFIRSRVNTGSGRTNVEQAMKDLAADMSPR